MKALLKISVTVSVTMLIFLTHWAQAYSSAKATSSSGVSSPRTSLDQHSLENNMRLWEIRTAPVAMLASWYTLDVSYRISENFATGPAVVIYNAPEVGNAHLPTYKGGAWGWHANYYFDSVVRNTWYLGARAYYESFRSYPHARRGYEDVRGVRSAAFLGFQWKWSRLNLMTGVGMEYRGSDVKDYTRSGVNLEGAPTKSRESELLPMIEIKLGLEI